MDGVYILILSASILVILCVVYFAYAKRLEFPLSTILKEFKIKSNGNTELGVIVELSIIKVNGWNMMTAIYTIMHYSFNISSIIFSCISIYFSFTLQNHLSILSTIIATLSLTCNLFLRCDRKWATFRNVLSEGRILTNDFISKFSSSYQLNLLTLSYANKIIRLEQSLKDSDLT